MGRQRTIFKYIELVYAFGVAVSFIHSTRLVSVMCPVYLCVYTVSAYSE